MVTLIKFKFTKTLTKIKNGHIMYWR